MQDVIVIRSWSKTNVEVWIYKNGSGIKQDVFGSFAEAKAFADYLAKETGLLIKLD